MYLFRIGNYAVGTNSVSTCIYTTEASFNIYVDSANNKECSLLFYIAEEAFCLIRFLPTASHHNISYYDKEMCQIHSLAHQNNYSADAIAFR